VHKAKTRQDNKEFSFPKPEGRKIEPYPEKASILQRKGGDLGRKKLGGRREKDAFPGIERTRSGSHEKKEICSAS